ncbi:MAG: methylated-DNA--[protein]-cysteine S-methyltransferase [Planctomycetaceae bacterium]
MSQATKFYTWYHHSPVGRLLLAGTRDHLTHLLFADADDAVLPDPGWQENDVPFREAVRQLTAYFQSELQEFRLPLAAHGTDFQKSVWNELCKVPYGETASYGDIARAIGRPTASRAVGMANGRNPIAIIIPCHRIIGAGGNLVGYGGGLNRKTRLLQLEGAAIPSTTSSG